MKGILLFAWSVVWLCGFGCRVGQAQSRDTTGGNKTMIQEREVTFMGAGGVELAGTLTLPVVRNTGKTPGLVLIAGSGPTDRDGNQLPLLRTDLLKQIAKALANQGVASLRFDKRVTGANSTKLPLTTDGLGDFCLWENFVDDSIAALRSLQKQPEVNTERTGFFGHSEGGLLALVAAAKIKAEPHPAYALVLASTPGRPLDEVIHDQLARTLNLQGATAEQSTFYLNKNTEIVTALRKAPTVPPDVPPGLAALYPAYLGRFLHSEFLISPTERAHGFTGPVLILQGEKDVQVLAAKDAPKLDAALKSRSGDHHTLAIVPGASHNLKSVTSEADAGFEGPVKEEALHALGVWVQTNLCNDPKSADATPRK